MNYTSVGLICTRHARGYSKWNLDGDTTEGRVHVGLLGIQQPPHVWCDSVAAVSTAWVIALATVRLQPAPCFKIWDRGQMHYLCTLTCLAVISHYLSGCYVCCCGRMQQWNGCIAVYTHMVRYSRGNISQLVAQEQCVIVCYSWMYICGYITSRVFWPYVPSAWTGPVAAVHYRQKYVYVTTEYATAGFYCTIYPQWFLLGDQSERGTGVTPEEKADVQEFYILQYMDRFLFFPYFSFVSFKFVFY